MEILRQFGDWVNRTRLGNKWDTSWELIEDPQTGKLRREARHRSFSMPLPEFPDLSVDCRRIRHLVGCPQRHPLVISQRVLFQIGAYGIETPERQAWLECQDCKGQGSDLLPEDKRRDFKTRALTLVLEEKESQLKEAWIRSQMES